jgi:heme/copper-type cytochrome/quinol oxidase subunit 2
MLEDSGISILKRRHSRLHVAMAIMLVINCVTLLFEVAELLGLFAINPDPDADLAGLEILYVVTAFALVIVAIVNIVLWCMWLHRAARNVNEAGFERFEFTPGWAVGWHFIPFANLVQPFKVMRQIWNASAADANDLDSSAPNVNLWWGTWLASGILGNASTRIALQAESPDTLYFGVVLAAVSSVAALIAIPTAMKMLRDIVDGQAARFEL